MPIISKKIIVRVPVKAGEQRQVVVSKLIPDDIAQIGVKSFTLTGCCGNSRVIEYTVNPKTV